MLRRSPELKENFRQASDIAKCYLELYSRWIGLDKFKEIFTQWCFEEDFKRGKIAGDEVIARCLLVDIFKISRNFGSPLKADDKASMVVFLLHSKLYGDHWCSYGSFLRCARNAARCEQQNVKYGEMEAEAGQRSGVMLFFEILARFDLEDRVAFYKNTERYFQFLVGAGAVAEDKVYRSSRRIAYYFNEERDLVFEGYVPAGFKLPSYGHPSVGSICRPEGNPAGAIRQSVDTLTGVYLAKQFNDWLSSKNEF